MNRVFAGVEKNTRENLKQLKRKLKEVKDEARVNKIEQLLNKVNNNELILAFCGHFSAGKSSLLNRLCGNNLLPSGPVPTSANLVTIKNGDSKASVTYHRNLQKQIMTVDPHQLDEYCVNGMDIESIEIEYPIAFLGEHTALMDTPGIDSTDEAHFVATESALHVSDVIFYVMDYNHVQSEINFNFTKRMKQWGKPLYLIINQIDKHREQELPFDNFRESIQHAFSDWGIHPDGILFLSLKEESHPENEWEKLLHVLTDLIQDGPSLIQYNQERSIQALIKAHLKEANQRFDLMKDALEDRLDVEKDTSIYESQLSKIEQEKHEILRAQEQLAIHLKREINGILEYANITPAVTRDLAHHYLQSRKAGFKSGFLASVSKTNKEIQRRMEQFQADFQEKVHAHIFWHLHDLFTQNGETYSVKTTESVNRIDSLSIEITSQWIEKQVMEGAVFTNEYTLNFCKQLAGEIKSMYRKRAYALVEAMEKQFMQQSQSQLENIEKNMHILHEKLDTVNEMNLIEQRKRKYNESFLGLVPADAEKITIQLPDLNGYKMERKKEQDIANRIVPNNLKNEEGKEDKEWMEERKEGVATGIQSNHRQRLQQASERLKETVKRIAEVPSFHAIAEKLIDKSQRLENNQFTIALFGAFSAGKSSFANALMGAEILPSSPNPMTAAINKISPPNDQWEHESAKITMKSVQRMEEDVLYSLQVLGENAATLHEALDLIAAMSPKAVSDKGKPHYSFLKAVKTGWDFAEDRLGTVFKADLSQFREFVAKEEKSCFIEDIELYYACPITDQGIMLVDTPGADSIHARHTGVAFHYIKNADAIMFVTYYNHAFSQADRQFLQQLGRVKDSFTLDKMFFIINATDLAADDNELKTVKYHVETNLARHEIRFPRIYPISSHMAVQGKIHQDEKMLYYSGISSFETDFNQFILDELTELAITGANQEIVGIVEILQKWKENAQQDAEKKKQQIHELEGAYLQVSAMLNAVEEETDQKEIFKHIDELFYYVKQRVSYRFGEFYNYSFNPSSLREGDQHSIKEALRMAWHELIRMISYELSQEVLATSLRIENEMHQQWKAYFNQKWENIQLILPSISREEDIQVKWETPEVGINLELDKPDLRWMMKQFRNGKYFFEQEGKKKLQEEIESKFLEPISYFITHHFNLFKEKYFDQYESEREKRKGILKQTIKDHYEGIKSSLDSNVDTEELSNMITALNKITA